MGLKELLPITFERANATQTYWNFQIVVILDCSGSLQQRGRPAKQVSNGS